MAITRGRRVLLASGIGAVLGLTACSAGTSPSASGGGPPPPVAVTLTLGVPDSPGFPPESRTSPTSPGRVRQLSGGQMKDPDLVGGGAPESAFSHWAACRRRS